LATQVESALERELSAAIMQAGAKPKRKKVAKGKTLVKQGDAGQDLFLLLNGVLAVEVDGEKVAELGPGAVLGERSLLEGRGRTSTLRAVTDARVAVVGRDQVSTEAMAELAKAHKNEQRGSR
jgi:CRP-like cAMP-binding protein